MKTMIAILIVAMSCAACNTGRSSIKDGPAPLWDKINDQSSR